MPLTLLTTPPASTVPPSVPVYVVLAAAARACLRRHHIMNPAVMARRTVRIAATAILIFAPAGREVTAWELESGRLEELMNAGIELA